MNRWVFAGALIVACGLAGCAAQEDVPLTTEQYGEHAPRSLQRARFLERRGLTDIANYKRTESAFRKAELLESAIDYFVEARDTLSFELAETPGPRLRREYLDMELLRLEGVLDVLVRRRVLAAN